MLEQEFLTCCHTPISLPKPNHKRLRLIINDVKKLNRGRNAAPEAETENPEGSQKPVKAKAKAKQRGRNPKK